MSRAGGVPDAWDDDWENVADKSSTAQEFKQPVKISRAERRAQHQEANKQLWQAAEEPERFSFLETKASGIPLNTADFKPTVKVLSRKPQIAKPSADPNATFDDGDDSEEEDRKRREADFVERQKRAQIEREEKQRKYAEVRQRLFGSPVSANPSRESSSSSQNRNPSNSDSRNSSRRGRTRGGGGAGNNHSRPVSAAQSPVRQATQPKQLYDPSYDVRPTTQSPRPAFNKEQQPIRAPRGPDNSGRGGFGFAPRGGRTSA